MYLLTDEKVDLSTERIDYVKGRDGSAYRGPSEGG